MKNSSDTIGNRIRDLPACSAVPQPTAPTGAPSKRALVLKYNNNVYIQAQQCIIIQQILT